MLIGTVRPVGRRPAAGFTLIELMIVVGVIAIIASIALPKYADLILRSQEGQLKGNLGSIRGALNLYYSDNGGIYPGCYAAGANSTVLGGLTPKYIDKIPTVTDGLHPNTNAVYCDVAMVGGSVHDGQGWYFDGMNPPDALNGTVWVACDHNNTDNSSWTAY